MKALRGSRVIDSYILSLTSALDGGWVVKAALHPGKRIGMGRRREKFGRHRESTPAPSSL